MKIEIGLSSFLKQGCHAISLFFTILPITIAESRLLDAPGAYQPAALFFGSQRTSENAGVQRTANPLRQVQSGERLVSVQRWTLGPR